MTSLKLRSQKDIVLSFNGRINELIKVITCKIASVADLCAIERTKTRMNLFKQIMGVDALIVRGGKYLLNYADHILRRDIDYIFTVDPAAECERLGEKVDSENEYMIGLFNNIRTTCANISVDEKAAITEMVYGLYKDYLEYVVVS
jgi:hypothetical protein